MFNVNERDSYRNPSHHSIVERNIQEAVSLGLRVCVGFNIYHQDFDGEQIIDLCIKHGINHLRFAVACPIYGSGSHQTVVPASEYNVISDKVFDFLMKCFSAGIEAVLDCPLPLCFFSDAQLGVLSKTQSGVVSRIGKCTPPVDIDFDLTLMRCFSIGSHVGKKKLTDFSSFTEIRQYFIQEVDSRLSRPTVYEKCGSCPYSTNCSGGCLSNNPGFLSMPSKM
jgi:cyclic pyranopterin phosphate synthase